MLPCLSGSLYVPQTSRCESGVRPRLIVKPPGQQHIEQPLICAFKPILVLTLIDYLFSVSRVRLLTLNSWSACQGYVSNALNAISGSSAARRWMSATRCEAPDAAIVAGRLDFSLERFSELGW